MHLLFISPEHPLYDAEIGLRFRVLREPLGLTRAQVRSPIEHASLHLVAMHADELLGCVLFHRESETHGRLFQMAVSARSRGTGLGRELVRALETELLRTGLRQVRLHARETAVGFYEQLGYRVHDAPFVEVGLPHRHMTRFLEP